MLHGLDLCPLWPGANPGERQDLGRDPSQQPLDLSLIWAR